ncbi:putative F-box associated interaction domain-containing protein [Rosa chinensis]|uniref:Putative F-box associated interaction domain-containing protein n=1 Tax=Rosa chinensis TaxID=74649 RepID=A0A2P6RPJ5_ROSCH|nr:putative F-box associated interaction domain-containing protein [Rosa chinensis]
MASFAELSGRKLTCPFWQPGSPRIFMLGSYNGMLCVALDYLRDEYYIWNPSTAFFLKLPNPNFASESKPDVCPHYGGFGYVSATDDYKVVVATFSKSSTGWSDMAVGIFSFRANSWKRVKSWKRLRSDLVKNFTKWTGVLLNEALHWLQRSIYRRQTVVAFDLGEEKFREIPLPPLDGDGSSICSSLDVGVVFGGCLCVSKFDGTSSEEVQLYLWIMKEYGVHESWTMLFKLASVHVDGFHRPVIHTESGIVLRS